MGFVHFWQMTTMRITFIALLLSLESALGQPQLPPLEKKIEDPSTGFNVQPGFVVDLVYKVDKKKYGSWIVMAFDNKGRLAVSDQGETGTFLIEIPKPGEAFNENKVKKLNAKSSLYGMLYALSLIHI